MKGWKLSYKENILKEGKKLLNDVKIIQSNNNEIIAQIDGCKVEAWISFNSPQHIDCECDKTYYCKHAAALMYYFEKNHELLNKNRDIKDIVNTLDSETLKKIVLSEIEKNKTFKEDFLKKFKNKPLNKEYYFDKLDDIINSGRDKEGFYKISVMKKGMMRFLNEDIIKILKAGDHSLACELMCKINDILSDELSFRQDGWYELTEEYEELVQSFIESIYLSKEERNALGGWIPM